jgi:uncharacterized protein
MNKDAEYWIEKLRLTPHPEGGYFRETYRAALEIPAEALPAQFSGARQASTAIYFLLEGANFSAFHRLRSDEMVALLCRRGAHRARIVGRRELQADRSGE